VSLCSEPRACSSRSMAGSGACGWSRSAIQGRCVRGPRT
jgi:hypothetical protein